MNPEEYHETAGIPATAQQAPADVQTSQPRTDAPGFTQTPQMQSTSPYGQSPQPGMPPYGQPPQRPPVPDTEETKRMKAQFSFFGPATLVYAILYAFCTFKNPSGVAFLLFIAGSLVFLCMALKRLAVSLRKDSPFYFAGMILLGISTFCTDDERLIFFNKLGIFLLMMSLLLSLFYETGKWHFGKWLGSIVVSCLESLGELERPFRDFKTYLQGDGRKNRTVWYVLLGVLVTLPLAAIVLALLGSADIVFQGMLDRIFANISFENVLGVLIRILFLFFAAYLLLSYMCRHKLSDEQPDHRKGEPVVAITVAGLMTLIYLVFSVVQIVYLFLGRLTLPEGYTYAEYAREGFFQLLAVGILNLVLVLVLLSFFRESRILKAVLTVTCLCSYIMIASSAMRMVLYIRYYDLTFLRILVLWTLCLLSLLFGGIIASVFYAPFPLFRYSCVVMTVLYIGLSFAHPDYWIAKYNLTHEKRTDFHYLTELSADAAPVLAPYLNAHEPYESQEASWRSLISQNTFERLNFHLTEWKEESDEASLRQFNVSRYVASLTVGDGS